MTLEEAIKHAEEVAVEQDKLRKRYDDASGYSRSHIESLRVTDSKKCEKCANEHRQLAEWLKDYKRLLDNRCQQNVDTIKTLEQEPKACHWEAKSFHELFCNNCGFDFDIMRNDFIDKMNYCPNCGERMVEPKESEVQNDI